MNYEDIRAEVLGEWDDIDGEDGRWISEAIDSALPIYYSDIIEQWTKMPSEYSDRWQEISEGEGQTITGLMLMDLYFYVSDQYREAYTDIEETKEMEQ